MFVCKECGTAHDGPGVCCGIPVVPLEEALGKANRLFEVTNDDRAANVLHKLKGDYEAAATKVKKTEEKLANQQQRRDEAAGVLLDFYKLTVTEAKQGPRTLMGAVVDRVNAGALDGPDATVTASIRG